MLYYLDATCLPGWNKCEQSCYFISPANDSFAVTWNEARQKCRDLGSSNHLASFRLAVNDKREQTCVNNLLKAQPPGAPGYWTDLNDLKVKGAWEYEEKFNNPPNNDVM